MKLNLLVYGLVALVLVVPGYFIISDMFSEPEVGDCLERGSAFHERVGCGTDRSQRVSKVTASADRSLCGDHEARTYPTPP